MKNKLIVFLARQIMNLIPKWKTRILVYGGYLISIWNIVATPEILQQIHDAFGWDLASNPTFGIISGVFVFLVNLFSEAKEQKHQEEVKIIKMKYNKAA